MRIYKGDIWYEKADIICITTNGQLAKSGDLIMGKGTALQAVFAFGQVIRRVAGLHIRQNYRYDVTGFYEYGFFTRVLNRLDKSNKEAQRIGFFQTKWSWRAHANLDLIFFSISKLNGYLIAHPEIKRVVLPFPGIGNGGLARSEVLPLLRRLDERVKVFER